MQTNPDSPFASVINLGPLKTGHPHKGLGKWVGLFFGGLCLLAAPALGLLALLLGYDAYNSGGDLGSAGEAMLLPLCFAGAALLIGALVVYNAWRNWPLQAALYENGFAHYDRKGLQQVRWEQIEAVWQRVTKHYTNGVYTGTTHSYTVQAQNGVKLVLDDKLAKVEDLGNAIQAGAAKALWPKYVAALQAGQRLTFGPLVLDANGLTAGKKALQWKDIKAIKIARGVISVKKEGGWLSWASATVPQIPNFYIFYELVGRFTKVE